MVKKLSAEAVANLLNERLSTVFKVDPKDSSDEQIYKASAMILKDLMAKEYESYSKNVKKENRKQVCYFCMEFLMGRSLKNTLFSLGLTSAFEKAYAKLGVKPERIY